MSSEFDLIKRHFTRPTPQAALGGGDDAALISPSTRMELAISTDMLVAGTHFFHDTDPDHLGWKSLAVNISDMAAMGAQPRWATLAIALPKADEDWIARFSDGFFACAEKFSVDLIGGDTTRGPLTISVTILGEVPQGQALRRDGAKIGDDIWVSGHLGSAAAGLVHLQGKIALNNDALQASLSALHRPVPRVELGLRLLGIAHSAIDISDGLAADLGHILQASNVGADIAYAAIPKLPALETSIHKEFESCVLSGGDDYELCFTTPQDKRLAIENIGRELNLNLARIGNTREGSDLVVYDVSRQPIRMQKSGYDHFST